VSSAAATQDAWVTPGEALRLAVPATVAGILTQLYRPLDQYYVNGLGVEAQAALGSVMFVLILFYSVFLLISAGAGPLVARHTGSGDAEARRHAFGAAIFAAGLVSLSLGVVGLLVVGPIVGQLGIDGLTAYHATDYLRVLFVTGAALVFAPLVTGVFHAMGDTTLPLLLQAGAVALNAALNPVLIYDAGLGTGGSALASTIAQSLAVGVGLIVLWRRTGMRLSYVRPGPELRRVLRIGAPIAVATAAYAIVYLLMLRTSINPLGEAVAAGLGIGFGALEGMTWPLYLGGSTALASMIGRCLGAGRPDLAWRAVRMIQAPVVALGVGCGLIFSYGGPQLVGIFAADEGALREGIVYASVLAWSQPFVAYEAYAEGVLAGAGDSRKLFWTTVPFNLLRVPLAYLLAIHLGWGAPGVWWAINATSGAKATAKGVMVWRGGWASLKL
jgi:MATE family multidrug resistance protein